MLAWLCTGWVVGCLLIHQLASLPNVWYGLLAGLALSAAMFVVRKSPTILLIVSTTCGVLVGASWTAWCASDRLADSLDPKLEGYVTRVSFVVTSIAKMDSHGQQFEAKRLDGEPLGVPQNLVIFWPGPVAPQAPDAQRQMVKPGEVWRAALILKRPRSKINPYLFDSEAHQFARNIRAIGTVRGQPLLIRDVPWSTAHTFVQRVRHHIRAAMLRTIGDKRYGPVLIALAVGDQNGVHAEDWKLFNLAGITHLVSISGSHVTLMAALIARLCLAGWKCTSWRGVALSSHIPAKVAAGCVAMVTAFCYCLLAGWGVPAQRTFFMLLVAWLAWTSRMRLSAHLVLSVAGFVVSLLDPWSVTSTGFWLSFGAVWVLWMAGHSTGNSRRGFNGRWAKCVGALTAATRLQWIISLSLVPVLCWLFQQISLASPLANAIAIPVVTLLVTPASLLIAIFSMLESLSGIASGLAWAAHGAFEWMMIPVSGLATAHWALVELPAFPVSLLAVSVVGLSWSLQPRGVPARWAGWLWMSMALCWSPGRPRPGEWHLLALDVGQASSVLIITHQHAMLFDAGGRSATTDDGERVVVPVLRALGIKKLDLVVISHEDRDHVGGLNSILKGIPVTSLMGAPSQRTDSAQNIDQANSGHSSVSHVKLDLSKEHQIKIGREKNKLIMTQSTCRRGLKWEMDKVQLEVLHPDSKADNSGSQQKKGKRNQHSCVLMISGTHHSVLLPGDISTREESLLLAAGMKGADVVMAPHHGSDSSSSAGWVRAVNAQHVIFQSGWLNRFGHPSGQVVARWQQAGARTWRTDQDGAIWVRSQKASLSVTAMRELRRRYWHVQH